MDDCFIRYAHAARTLLCAAVLLGGSDYVNAEDYSSLYEALLHTTPLVNIRARYEQVDQLGIADDAKAGTIRARLGGETGSFLNTRLLAEGEGMFRLNDQFRPDNAVAAYVPYPVIADPQNYVINRLQLSNTSLPQTTVTIGRQRILLDDQRFVGNTGWRQNEVTFDAARVVNASVPGLTVDLTLLNKVHRVYGVDSPQGTYKGDSYLVNASYQTPIGKLTGFAYLLDFDPIKGLAGSLDPRLGSTSTYGGRVAGEWPVTMISLGYTLSYASQKPRGDNPYVFNNDYALVEAHAVIRQLTFRVGDENMHGNGTVGFQTPLATVHLFDGWANKFLVTPANGLDDRYATVTWKMSNVLGLDLLSASAVYRRFGAEHLDTDYGREPDFALSGKWHRYTGLLQFADYSAAPTTPTAVARDTTKLWAQIEYIW